MPDETLAELEARYARLCRNRDDCARLTADPDYTGDRAGPWMGVIENEVAALEVLAEILKRKLSS